MVAAKPHRPRADVRMGMPKQLGGQHIVESACLMQCPQSLQGSPTGFGFDRFSELVLCRLICTLAQQAYSGLPMPLIWVRQKPDELPVGFCAEVCIGNECFRLGAKPINTESSTWWSPPTLPTGY